MSNSCDCSGYFEVSGITGPRRARAAAAQVLGAGDGRRGVRDNDDVVLGLHSRPPSTTDGSGRTQHLNNGDADEMQQNVLTPTAVAAALLQQAETDTAAMFTMGLFSSDSADADTDADNTRAIVWFLRAARRGDRRSQILLAQFYAAGLGTARDDDKAARFRAAASEADVDGADFSSIPTRSTRRQAATPKIDPLAAALATYEPDMHCPATVKTTTLPWIHEATLPSATKPRGLFSTKPLAPGTIVAIMQSPLVFKRRESGALEEHLEGTQLPHDVVLETKTCIAIGADSKSQWTAHTGAEMPAFGLRAEALVYTEAPGWYRINHCSRQYCNCTFAFAKQVGNAYELLESIPTCSVDDTARQHQPTYAVFFYTTQAVDGDRELTFDYGDVPSEWKAAQRAYALDTATGQWKKKPETKTKPKKMPSVQKAPMKKAPTRTLQLSEEGAGSGDGVQCCGKWQGICSTVLKHVKHKNTRGQGLKLDGKRGGEAYKSPVPWDQFSIAIPGSGEGDHDLRRCSRRVQKQGERNSSKVLEVSADHLPQVVESGLLLLQGTPFVFRGLAMDTPIVKKWAEDSYLVDNTSAGEEFEVKAPLGAIRCMNFPTFLEKYQQLNLYMRGGPALDCRSPVSCSPVLREDAEGTAGMLTAVMSACCSTEPQLNFWFGFGATKWSQRVYTPTHFDEYCTVSVLCSGCKVWWVRPPGTLPTPRNTSRATPFDVGEQHLWTKVELQPGDVFVMPPGWWHFVESFGRCLAVNWWSEQSTREQDQLR
jgi:hypothetical protein